MNIKIFWKNHSYLLNQENQDEIAKAFSNGGIIVNAELDARKQQIDDTPESYVFEVMEVFDANDPNMTDTRRVRFLLRGNCNNKPGPNN